MSLIRNNFKVFLLILISTPFLSCGKSTISDTHFEHKSGIYFEFPEGWSHIGKKEWQDRGMGVNQTLITVADPSREAFFVVVPMELDLTALEVNNIMRGKKQSHTTMLIEAIHKSGPLEYRNYKLVDKGLVDFGGREVGEIIFEGTKPGKELRWHQILIAVDENKEESYYMLIFSVPPKKLDQYDKEFAVIDKTWRWPL